MRYLVIHGYINSMINRYIIIHGTKGSPSANWFPWLAAQLRARGAGVLIPQMPTPEGQSLASWLTALSQQVSTVDSQTCIIGHSVGAVFLLRYLERCAGPLGSSVFVAGFTGTLGNPEYDQLNSTFVDTSYDWIKIRRNAGRIVCIAGDDDPYVPLSQPSELAEHLGAQLQLIPGGGHLNSEFGYDSFPMLLEQLLTSG